jgi:hypothetical protein
VSNTFEMDGRELFMKFAEKVARGELAIVHFTVNLDQLFNDYDVRAGMRTWDGSKLDLTITAVENPTGKPTPATVTMSPQVRELIFDEEPVPIYDEDLK